MSERPAFRCGYDGATDYTFRGKTYELRHHAAGFQREPEDRLIGCIFCRTDSHEFPPAELLAYFPGYVAARYAPTGETYTIGTTCGPLTVDRCMWEFAEEPRQEDSPMGRRAVAWREEMERHGITA